MDSLTQAALGAAVGEAVLGRRVGNKAPLWGAAFGTLPDLDVLANVFLDPVGELQFHRGLSHSFFFAAVTAPLFGWLLARWHRDDAVPARGWACLVFAAFVTHALIDACTTYGTQLFQPFSDYPVSFNTIFIIDPLYTLPLLIGVGWALIASRTRGLGHRANTVGLVLSTAYLLCTVAAKAITWPAFERALAEQGIRVERMMTTPTPLNALLWTAIADDGEALWVGLRSVLDDGPEVRFRRIPRHADRLASLQDQRAVRVLLWFSRGYFTVSDTGEGLVFHDLRFGRSDAWLTDRGAYIFNFRLRPRPDPTRPPDDQWTFEQAIPSFDARSAVLGRLWRRMWGDRAAEVAAGTSGAAGDR
ncbi:MAG: metal-dependent hydrolase [Bacteroidetes bacterium]|nr:MAG: metal-dependent hydrolase [Bacteroidota bacterium]